MAKDIEDFFLYQRVGNPTTPDVLVLIWKMHFHALTESLMIFCQMRKDNKPCDTYGLAKKILSNQKQNPKQQEAKDEEDWLEVIRLKSLYAGL